MLDSGSESIPKTMCAIKYLHLNIHKCLLHTGYMSKTRMGTVDELL